MLNSKENTGLPRCHGGKESTHQYRRWKRCGFNPWVRRIPWNRKWQSTPLFLPGKFHGCRILEGYKPRGCKEMDTTERLSLIGKLKLENWHPIPGCLALGEWSHHHDHHMHKENISSVQLSCSVVSDSLRPHESQHARPPCPSPTPRAYSSSCPLSRWCHPVISSSVGPFSSCPQSLPASGSFPVSQLFAWGDQSIGVSASASVLPTNTQDRSPLGWNGWISSQSKGLSRVFSNTTVQKHQFFSTQLSSQSNCHIHTWPMEKP